MAWFTSYCVDCIFVQTTAQDLLEQWAAEKLNFSDAYMNNDHLEISASTTAKTATDIKREWDRLYEDEIGDCLSSAHDADQRRQSSQNHKQPKNGGEK